MCQSFLCRNIKNKLGSELTSTQFTDSKTRGESTRWLVTSCYVALQVQHHLFIRLIAYGSFYAHAGSGAAPEDTDPSLLTPVLTPLTCGSVQRFSIFTPKIEREEGEVTLRTATSGAPRRAETRREAALRSSMALSNVLETPAAGFNFDNTARYELCFYVFRAADCNNGNKR